MGTSQSNLSAKSESSANQWWAVAVVCPLALEDSVYWQFEQLGCQGTVSERQGDSPEERLGQRCTVTAYFLSSQFQPSDFAGLKDSLLKGSSLEGKAAALPSNLHVSWHLINEEDWARSWKTHWQAEKIGDRLLINPAWMTPPPTERTILTLDPGSAFGTGAHATTQLCLKALEKQALTSATIADIGCGSGILSIVSLLYGAAQAYATDVDPLAVKSTRANADLNQIPSEKLQVQLGSLPEAIAMAAGPVDGIVCNILAEIIVELIIPHLSELAGPNTWGILSGILTRKSDWVEEHLSAHGWQVIGITQQDEWCAMTIRLAS